MKKRIRKTKKLIETLRPFWKAMRFVTSVYFKELSEIEKNMEKKTGIKGLFFFWCDDEIVGIGNDDRTLDLIHDSEFNE